MSMRESLFKNIWDDFVQWLDEQELIVIPDVATDVLKRDYQTVLNIRPKNVLNSVV